MIELNFVLFWVHQYYFRDLNYFDYQDESNAKVYIKDAPREVNGDGKVHMKDTREVKGEINMVYKSEKNLI